MMYSRLRGAVAIAALFALFSSTLSAQATALSEDMRLVRGLLTKLRFISYAQHVVTGMKKTYKDSADFKQVALLEIEVAIKGAKLLSDRDAKRAAFKKAIELLTGFVEQYEGQQVADEARVSLSEACIEFGGFLIEEIEIAREEAPEKVDDLEAQAGEIFRTGTDACTKSENAFKAKDKVIESCVAWLRRGILQRMHGRAVKKDRIYLCDLSDETLDDLIMDIGEETLLGQKALFEKSKIDEVRGDLDSAIQLYTDAISAIWEALTFEPPPAEAAARLMFAMMQEVYDTLAAAMFKQGRNAEILKLVEEFEKRIKEFETVADPRFGDSIYLTQARVWSSSGKQELVSKALKVAKTINKRHPADYVGLLAKNLIRDILRHSTDLVTGDLLREIAIGDMQSKSYDAAIGGFKRSLSRMDRATKDKLGFDTWVRIGRCNQIMQRYLEAALAYSRGLEDYGDAMKSVGDADPAAKKANADALKSAGNRALSCITRVVNASNKDRTFDSLHVRIKNQASAVDTDKATARDYNEGLKKKRAKEYVAAAATFFTVKPSFDRYELAIGHSIECLFRAKEFGKAAERIAWFRNYVKTHKLEEEDHAKRGYRPQALAWAHYYEGRVLYAQATGKVGEPDLTKFRDVTAHFLQFEQNHSGKASNLMPFVHTILGHAYLEMGDQDKAMARYNELKKLGTITPDAHKRLGAMMFENYKSQAAAIDKELAALIKAGKDKEANKSARARDAARKSAVKIGIDYAKTVGKPKYEILYSAMRLAQRVRDWPNCEWAANKILSLYGKSTKKSLRQVKPLLGFALLRQSGRLREALDILNKAEKELAAGIKTTAYYNVRRYQALAMGGSPELDENFNYRPNPGLGRPVEAYKILRSREYHKFAMNRTRVPRYTIEWFRYHLECYYFARAAQRDDSSYEGKANTLFQSASTAFEQLQALGPEGKRLYNLFNRIGRK